MENNQDLTTGNLSRLKEQAQRSVIEQNGKFIIQFDTPVPGVDTSRTYDTKDLAVDAAFNFLKNRGVRAA
jgi:hypothetical protein